VLLMGGFIVSFSSFCEVLLVDFFLVRHPFWEGPTQHTACTLCTASRPDCYLPPVPPKFQVSMEIPHPARHASQVHRFLLSKFQVVEISCRRHSTYSLRNAPVASASPSALKHRLRVYSTSETASLFFTKCDLRGCFNVA
jgi:hypothetical protein